jgi:methylated-DNA-[protein]-cysteine S-methyltransferase
VEKLFLKKQLGLLVSVWATDCIQKVELSLYPPGFACYIAGTPSESLLKEICRFCERYIDKVEGPTPPLDWGKSTPFTRTLLHILPSIPFGQHRTYGELAQAIGHPKSFRAIGGACGRNPFPFFLPCHRVIGKKGLGGFSQGMEIKKSLLTFELNKLLA